MTTQNKNERRSSEDYLQEVWDSLEPAWDKSKFDMKQGYDSEYECDCITITSKDNEGVLAKIYVNDYEGKHPVGFDVVYRYPGDKGVGVIGSYEFQSIDMDGLGEEVFDYFDEIKKKVGESMNKNNFYSEDEVLRVLTGLIESDEFRKVMGTSVLVNDIEDNLEELQNAFLGSFYFDDGSFKYDVTVENGADGEVDHGPMFDACADVTDKVLDILGLPDSCWDTVQEYLFYNGVSENIVSEPKKSEADATFKVGDFVNYDAESDGKDVYDSFIPCEVVDVNDDGTLGLCVYGSYTDKEGLGEKASASCCSKLDHYAGMVDANTYYTDGKYKAYKGGWEILITEKELDPKVYEFIGTMDDLSEVVDFDDYYGGENFVYDEDLRDDLGATGVDTDGVDFADMSGDVAKASGSPEESRKSEDASVHELEFVDIDDVYSASDFDDLVYNVALSGQLDVDTDNVEQGVLTNDIILTARGYNTATFDFEVDKIVKQLAGTGIVLKVDDVIKNEDTYAKKSEANGNKDIFTLDLTRIDADGDEEGLDDMQAAQTFYDEDDAIKAAKELADSYKDDDGVVQVTVMAGEQEKPNGNIVGEPFDIFTASSSNSATTAKYREKAGYTKTDGLDYYAKGGTSEAKKSEARPTKQDAQIKELCKLCRNDKNVAESVFKALTKDYNTSLDPVLAGQYLMATWKSKLEELGGCNGWYDGFKKLYAAMGSDFVCSVLQDLKLGSSGIGCGACITIVNSIYDKVVQRNESKKSEGLPPKKLANRLYRSRADLINKMKTLDAVEITTPAQFNDIHSKQWLHTAGYAMDINGNLVGQTYFGDKDGKWYYATTKTFQGDYLPECKQTEGLWDDWDGKDPKIGIYYTEDELAILKDVFKKYVQEVSGIHYSVPADYTISYDIAEDPLNHFNAVVKAVGKNGKPIYLCNLAGEVFWEPNTPKQFSYYVGQVDSKTGEEKKGKYVIPPRSFFLDADYYANAKADTRIPLNPSDWDKIDDYFKKFFKQSSESNKSESLTLKQKELKDMARFGQAEDITTISDVEAKELKKKGIETVGISRGTYGMNGALLRDNEGKKYVITARSSNLFYFV